jgi:tripartite-type tricarboxylate transporter receptor subunit TctC
MYKIGKIAVTAALLAGGVISQASANMAEYFKDRTITIIIPYGPGGTYDKYGSSFSKHIGNFIPGKPTVILQHMPGAGGAKAMIYTYNVAPKKGFHMVVPLDNLVINQLLRPKRMKYKSDKFNYLGSSNQTNSVMAVRTDSGVNGWKDMKNIQIIGSSSGTNSSTFLMARLSSELLGLKIKMVTGYKGSSRAMMAMEQGESQMSSPNWLAWSSKVPHWFTGTREGTKGKPFAVAVLQNGFFKDPALPNTPMLTDLVPEKDKALARFIASAGPLGRGLAYPPAMRKDLVDTLRNAYDGMNGSKKFVAELKKKKLRLIATKGTEIQKIVSDTIKEASPAVISKVRKLVYGRTS